MFHMSAGKDKTSWLVASGPGLVVTVVLGAGLGYLFAGDLFNKPAHDLMPFVALGLVWAVLLLQWLDLLVQGLSFSTRLIPEDLDIANREEVRDHVEGLTGGQMIAARTRRLLTAWAEGATPDQVIALASFQSQQARQPMRAAAAFAIILLAGSIWQGGHTVLAWAAFVVVGVTVLARQNLLSRADHFIEIRLLSRLPGDTASAAGGSDRLAKTMGEAVHSAFEQFVPQPERMAESIREAVQGAGGSWAEQLTGSLAQHSDNVQAATQQLGAQLDKIAEMQANIEQVLHLQEAVEGTLKTVSASQEFEQTLNALRNHVEETDKVLRELAKPRRIRLVEGNTAPVPVRPPPAPEQVAATPAAAPPVVVETPSLHEADSES